MQFIIDFKNDTHEDDITAYLASADCLIVRTFDAFQKVYLVESDSTPPMTDIVESIINDSENPIQLLSYPIEEGQKYPKVTFSINGAEDWWKVASSHNPDLEAETQEVFRRGANATVYIVDSGVMNQHEDFEFVDVSTLYSFNGDATDYNGHGTAIASVISGNVCGLASPKIRAVKVFQSGVPTLQSHLLAAFDAILESVALNPNSFPIVNLSWSIAKNEYIESKIRALMQQGISVIVAAGNSGIAIENVTPASMPEVCTVGAYDQDFEPANFSNYTGDISNTEAAVNGGALDVWAPGVSIRVAKLDGTYGYANGTSIAAAIHSAAVAYNSYRFVLSDGTQPEIIKRDVFNVSVACSGRAGILTLTEQYANSINMVTKFGTSLDGDNGTSLSSAKTITLYVRSGERLEKMMPGELITDNFALDLPLPEGFEFDGDWLVGSKVVTEPFVFSSPLSYTTYGGRIIEGTFTLVVLPEEMAMQDAGLDPQIEIQLLDTCTATLIGGGPNYNCQGNCAINGGICEDACGAPSGKSTDPGQLYCYCTGAGFTDCP